MERPRITLTASTNFGAIRRKQPLSRILPWLMVKLTRHPRQVVSEIEWSDRSFIFNLFRIYERIFGRRAGIRPDHTSSRYRDEDGIVREVHTCHSLENFLVFTECRLREYLRGVAEAPKRVRIFVPQLQTTAGFPVPASPFLFSIAFDATTSDWSSNSTGNSFSHTTAGSNRGLLLHVPCGGSAPDSDYASFAATYSGTSMTSEKSQTQNQRRFIIMSLIAPATGANNVVTTWSGGGTEIFFTAVSYTGVDQTDMVDATAGGDVAGSDITNPSISITTVSDNAWVSGGFFLRSGTATGVTADSPSTMRQSSGGVLAVADRSTTTAGSYSIAFTLSGGHGGSDANDVFALVAVKSDGITSISISVSDQLNISEAVTMVLISLINLSDQLNLTESVSIVSILNISVSDQITVTDTQTVESGTFNISVSDQLTLTESVTVFLPFFNIIVSDQLNITESASVALAVDISVSDSISISESVTTTLVFNVSVSDQLTVSESVTMEVTSFISVSDQLNITESKTLTVSDIPKGFVMLRGRDQDLPVTLSQQEYPLGMRDQAQM